VLARGLDRELVGELLDHVAHARHRGVDDERPSAARAQRPDAELERAGAGGERDVDGVVGDVRGGTGRDDVGDEDRVVESVEGQVGARDAITSATRTASSSRSSGRSARAASMPTTRRSTGPTKGPAAIETRVGASASLT
jgi:hypothetical protein